MDVHDANLNQFRNTRNAVEYALEAILTSTQQTIVSHHNLPDLRKL